GVSVVNALSTRLDVDIHRDGRRWTQHYENSKPGELVDAGPAEGSGTSVTFWADPEIFETTEYNAETVARRLQEMAFLNKGLTIVLRDERVTDEEGEDATGERAQLKERTYYYPGGLEDFVKYINASREAIHPSVISFE